MKRLAFVLALLFAANAHAQSHMPDCLPTAKGAFHVDLGIYKVPATASARADSWLAWVCSLPTGYVTEAWIFSVAGEVTDGENYLAGKLTLAQAQALCATNCWTLTASEQAFVNGLLNQYAVKAVVAASGTATTRQVYSAFFVPIGGETVAIGAPCNPALHMPAHPLPTPGALDPYPFYDVSGQPNASSTGAFLPPGSFAYCKVTLPSIGIGNL